MNTSEIFMLITLAISVIAFIVALCAYKKAKLNEKRLKWSGVIRIETLDSIAGPFTNVKITNVRENLEEVKGIIALILEEFDLEFVPEKQCSAKLISTKKEKAND